MSCSKCGSSNNTQIVYTPTYYNSSIDELKLAATNCTITKEQLLKYQQLLQCCKDNTRLAEIGLSTVQYNSYMGFLQSALNYPDNYCYYIVKIQEFANNILPRIITNVPICTDQF